MRVHLTRPVIELLYALREDSAALRAAIEVIRRNPAQPDAIDDPDRPGRKELFVRAGSRGFWLGYTAERIGGETVITIGVDEN